MPNIQDGEGLFSSKLLPRHTQHTEEYLPLRLVKQHTHTHLTALCPGLPGWAGTRKVKTNLDFTEASDSEWQWHQLGHMQVCTSLQADNHARTPPLSFLQAGCSSCHPTNSVKALKVGKTNTIKTVKLSLLDCCCLETYIAGCWTASIEQEKWCIENHFQRRREWQGCVINVLVIKIFVSIFYWLPACL